MTVKSASDASNSAPSPSPAMAIMIANAAIRPNDASTDARMPSFAPFDSDSTLFGPNAMLMAKQAGTNSEKVWSVIVDQNRWRMPVVSMN